jgi:hypothetical protein
MKRLWMSLWVLGTLALPVSADNGNGANGNYVPIPNGYNPAIPNYGQGPTNQVFRMPVNAASCGSGGCSACGNANDTGGTRIKKFINFLFYRPMPPAEFPTQPTPWTPPLTAWFPNTGCVAMPYDSPNPPWGRGVLAERHQAKTQAPCGANTGCATCAGSIGGPTVVASAPMKYVPTNLQNASMQYVPVTTQNTPKPAGPVVSSSFRTVLNPQRVFPASTVMPANAQQTTMQNGQQMAPAGNVMPANTQPVTMQNGQRVYPAGMMPANLQPVPAQNGQRVYPAGNVVPANMQPIMLPNGQRAYPAGTIMVPTQPGMTQPNPAPANISPYGGLPGGYRVEPNPAVLPSRPDY